MPCATAGILDALHHATMPPYSFPRNLRDLLRAEPRLDPDRAARLLADVATVLAPRHAQGEAHGGLTPERVLLDADGHATLAAPPADDHGALAPWPAYLAPEQIDGREPDPASDVYALGLLGWEMLAGQPPWAGESLYCIVLKQREQDLPRLSTLRPGLPRHLVFAIEGALHKSPGDRWRDADEMLAQLDPAAHPDHGAEHAYDHAYDHAHDHPHAFHPAVTLSAPAAGETVPIPRHVEPHHAARGPVVGMPAVPPAPAAPRRPSRLRPLGLAALAVAVLGAGAAALAVFQGSEEKGSTQAWLDSVSAGGATGEVVAESTLTVAEERARDQARRDSLARVARATARRDSLRAAAAAESAQAADTAAGAAPRDTTARPDTTPAPTPPPTTPPTTPPATPPTTPPATPPNG